MKKRLNFYLVILILVITAISTAHAQVGIPVAPVATQADWITATGFNANWGVVNYATGYYLDVATDSSFTNFVSGYNNLQLLSGFNPPTIVTGLSPGTTYYYRVRAYNNYGTSGNSNTISVTTSPPPIPAAPVATGATAITTTGFNVNWGTVSGATGYYLDVATDSSFTNFVSGYNNLQLDPFLVFCPPLPLTGLIPETTYYYRVRAYNSWGTSGNSNTISVATSPPPIPAAPTATQATGITATGFTANWGAVSGAVEYYLDLATNSGFTSFVTGYNNLRSCDSWGQCGYTAWVVTGLTPGTTYSYRVRAHNTYGTSDNSNTISVTTIGESPPAYSLADLTGTWQVNQLGSAPTPFWLRGTSTNNPDGTYTMSYTRNDGSSGNQNGTLFISPDGVITEQGVPDLQCRMDSGKTVAVCTSTTGDGTTVLGVNVKKGSSYSLADLTGTWYVNQLGSGATPFWLRGTSTNNLDGTYTGSYTLSNGSSGSGGGTLYISPDGIITQQGVSGLQCGIDSGKTVAVCTSTANDGTAVLDVNVKKGSSYSLADLTGTWQVNQLGSAPTPFWLRGTSTNNPDGTYTGLYTLSSGSSGNKSGTVFISPDGVITEQGILSAQCAMDPDKTVGVCTSTGSDGTVILGVNLKEVLPKNLSTPFVDFDGDNKSDISVWRPGDGYWYIISSKDGTIKSQQWGSSALNDVLVPGDYDGDGKTDYAVWRPAEGFWYIISSKDGSITATQWGAGYAPYNDVAVPGDYDGDGKTDIAIWRPGDGHWYIISSKDGSITATQWGSSALNDVLVPGDYDGDGKTDIAVWRPAEGYWYVINSKDGSITATQWGAGYAPYNDKPVPGDYDGDGKTDIAIWREADGYWYIINSKDGSITATQWGAGYAPYNDEPISE